MTVGEYSRFMAGLSSEVWVDGVDIHARMEVQPAHLRPGTDRVRLGVLATLIDVIGGSPAHAILNPTVDLRVSLIDRMPATGKVELVCRPVRIGRRLFVGETVAHTGDESTPFAKGICTFINRPIPGMTHDGLVPGGSLGADNYDSLFEVREPAPDVFELDNHAVIANPHSGTVQGGAQSIFAELVAELVLEREEGREHEVVDLDMRYLDALRTPTLRAKPELLRGTLGRHCVRVAMVEADDEERLVALATLLCRAVP